MSSASSGSSAANATTPGSAAGTASAPDDQFEAPALLKRDISWECSIRGEVDGLPEFSKEPPPKQTVQADGETGRVQQVAPLDQITVGRKFLLSCQGEPVIMKKSDVKLIATTDKPFGLQLLEVRRLDERSGDFLVASYQAGPQKIENTQLSDGKHIVQVKPFEFTVASVLQPAKDGKPPKPYPSYGPIELTWPTWVWIALAMMVALVLGFIVAMIGRRISRTRLLRELKQYDTALSPFDQFNKEIRQIKREVDFVGDEDKKISPQSAVLNVDRALRLYLVREFRVPALDWGERMIEKDFRKRYRQVFDECRDDLRVAFREVDKAVANPQRLTEQDVVQLATLTTRTVSQIWRENNRQQGRGK